MIAHVLVTMLALHAPVPAAARPTPEQDVRAALARYVQLVRKMDHAGIAATFAPDGEIVNPGQDPVRGPAAIEAFLRKFSGYKVLSETMTASTTSVTGANASQTGTYRQTVRTPEGQVLHVSGGFTAEWVRNDAGAWRIRRMATSPSR